VRPAALKWGRAASAAVAGCVLALSTFPLASSGAEPEIVEVVNATYAIQDRCMTCHAAAVEGYFPTDGPVAESFHRPALLAAHPVAELGCSVCHGGNPLATEKQRAHGLEADDRAPLFTGLHTQSRCVRCHRDTELPGTEFLQRGRALIDDRACFACHEIPGGEQRERVAPTLGNIAKKVHPEWIVEWLTDPTSYFAGARMPNYYLTREQATAIASYLVLSLSEPVSESSAGASESAEKLDRTEARRLLKQSACLDCHRMRGTGGSPGIRAPDLSRIGDKVRVPWLVEWLQGPQHLQPGAGMPSFRFSEAEATTLARYLAETFSTRRTEGKPAETQIAVDPSLTEAGKVLVNGLGCMSCHGGPGEKPEFKLGPDLRQIGNRDVRGLYWASMGQDWNLRLASYLRTKVSTPRAFNKNHLMPNYQFAPDEVEAIVVALLSFAQNPVPEASRFSLVPDEPALEPPTGAAAVVFQRYQCLQCHSLRGRFGTVAPDLGWEGDKVQRDWLVGFLKEPYPIRPASTLRMPNFGMTDEEVQIAADFIESNWWDDAVPPDPFAGKAPDPELVERGRELFADAYSCLDCHQVGEEGELDGPVLTEIGSRLQPGWIYQWILDPQRFYPNDMDSPEATPEDALALTAYLTTLRNPSDD